MTSKPQGPRKRTATGDSLRSADTMSEAIALSSPSGSMSKRGLSAANERLRRALFGDGLPMPSCPQPTRREALLRDAAMLRDLANRGFRTRYHNRHAAMLEAEANA